MQEIILMLSSKTIPRLSLIREIQQPRCREEQLEDETEENNEHLLGKSSRASEAAYAGVQAAANGIDPEFQIIIQF